MLFNDWIGKTENDDIKFVLIAFLFYNRHQATVALVVRTRQFLLFESRAPTPNRSFPQGPSLQSNDDESIISPSEIP